MAKTIRLTRMIRDEMEKAGLTLKDVKDILERNIDVVREQLLSTYIQIDDATFEWLSQLRKKMTTSHDTLVMLAIKIKNARR